MATSTSSFWRDGNRVPITQNGVIVSKDITFTTDGTVVKALFTVTGSVMVNALYGVVTTALGSNHTAASFRINDQTAQVYLTAVGGTTLSSIAAGSFIIKDKLVAVAVTKIDNAAGVVTESATAGIPLFSPVIITKKTAALTQIEYRYITNNTSLGAMTVYCGFIPLSGDGDVAAA
ncbi:MAG: hypothetical protein NUV44_01065 [Candidatus Scalindua sp.]|nr:hypothetical protein [Candidatus Scalindua sp.]